ncbi:hypothetical protein BXY51_006254 [Actinoplanes cyaneus]|nr:hypothetical protein [Actinoplanes cyaneus]
MFRYSSVDESPLQLGASVTSSVTCRGVPANVPSGCTSTTHSTLATTNAIRVPSGDHTGPSSPRVCSDRDGSGSTYRPAPVTVSTSRILLSPSR